MNRIEWDIFHVAEVMYSIENNEQIVQDRHMCLAIRHMCLPVSAFSLI